jgi:transposase
MYACQQILVNQNNDLIDTLKFFCEESHKLTNLGIYYARQLYFKAQKDIGKFDLEKEYKANNHYKVLYSQAAQQILRTVAESIKFYLGIDPGLNTWLTCVSNVGTSFLVDGKHIKLINRWYNKQVSTIKENQLPTLLPFNGSRNAGVHSAP